MTDLTPLAAGTAASFDERVEILAEELELAIKWQRPSFVILVCSSAYMRAEVEAELANDLADLGQKSIHLSVRGRNPKDIHAFFEEFKDPARSVYFIDGFRWGRTVGNPMYSTISLQREFLMERRIRAVFWVTPVELTKLTRAVPDLWAYRDRVFAFAEAPNVGRVRREALESTWQGTGDYSDGQDDTEAKISMREDMLADLPKGEEASSIRGNLLLTLGVLNWRQGDFERADEQLREALQIASKLQDKWFEAECFNAAALLRSSTNRIDEAIDAYKQALRLAPDQIFVWNNLGNLCAKVGRNDEAMIAFRKALETNPRDPSAWNGLANVHSKLGYFEEAIAAYRKSIQQVPTFTQPWCGLGDAYASIGRAEEAQKCYQKAIELNRQFVTPWLRLAVLLAKKEQHREAIKAYHAALELDDKNSEVWNELGKTYLKAGFLDEAANSFARAIESDRGNGWSYSNLAFAYAQLGKHKEGVSLLLRSIDLLDSDADRAVSWNRLGSIYRALNDYDNAVAAYRKADMLVSKSSTTAAAPRAKIMAGSGADAETMLWPTQEAAPSATPTNPEDFPVAAAEVAPGRKSNRRIDAETISEPLRSTPRARLIGTADPTGAGEADVTSAIQAEDREVAMKPAADPRNRKSRAAARLAQRSEAQESQRVPPVQEAVAWTEKGNAYFGQGSLEEAINAYSTAIQLDPSYGIPYGNLALTYVTQGHFAEAILLFQKGIELLESDGDKALCWNGLGNAYRCVDDYANAVTAYQRAAELDPETGGIRDGADNFPSDAPRSSSAWNDLGELLLQTGAPAKAIDALQKAIELEPESGRAYSNLGRAHAAQGRYAEAVPFFEKGIALTADDKEKAIAWNGLGNVFRKMNDYDRAVGAYQKAVLLADEGVDLLTRTRFSLLSNVDVQQQA